METDAYQQILDTIYKLGRFGIKLELDTILDILRQLGDPHKKYNLVHVAGTNGKGSVASYITSVLSHAGFTTGLYTSPHLIRFNERIVLNGSEISNDDVVSAYEAVHAADNGERQATYFEIVTAMAFHYFAQQNVDWAVIETGMGGRFDATNVITPEISVITNLSIEHTEYLGSTIKDLAREKGGIIKPGVPVVTGVHQPSGLAVLKDRAAENNAELYQYKKDFSARKTGAETYEYKGIFEKFSKIKKPLPGEHQKENLSIALAACEALFKRMAGSDTRYNLSQNLVSRAIEDTRWPGRLEHVQLDPLVIIDGAHNLAASKVLAKHLTDTLKDTQLTLVLGILDDKPYEKMLKNLVPCADRVIITKAQIDRSLDTIILKQAVEKFARGPVTIIEDVKQAVDHAIKTSDTEDAVCIAGSLYVAGEAREKFDTP